MLGRFLEEPACSKKLGVVLPVLGCFLHVKLPGFRAWD